jgi:hypothetical protein
MARTPPDRRLGRSLVSDPTLTVQDRVDDSDWQGRRRPASAFDRVASRTAQAWLQHLPPELMPRELVQRFPRVLNQIALLWQSPAECCDYFDSLLIDRRGSRRGFPLPVMREIAALFDYYREKFPQATRLPSPAARERGRG